MNMHSTEEILKNRKIELQQEIDKIDIALETMVTQPFSKEEAIIEAVRAGNHRPINIHRHLRTRMRMNIPQGSIRTMLSRMKKENKIKHDDTGWVI